MLLSHHASFVEILSNVFPGDKKSTGLDEDTVDLGKAPTVEAAIAQINSVLKW